MIVSIVLLKIRYSIQHYIGAFFILLGIIVSLIPQFRYDLSIQILIHLRTLHDDGTAWAIFLIALAAVSLGSATLYMEHNIKEKVKKLTRTNSYFIRKFVSLKCGHGSMLLKSYLLFLFA